MALVLIILGLLLLGFGVWVLVGMFWPKGTTAPGNREPQAIQRDIKPAPRTIALSTNVQGTSTAEQSGQIAVSPLSEAKRRAESVVSRMGSGTSQDGFLGYEDVMLDGTANFQTYLRAEQAKLKSLHPASGPLYGVTTRVVASNVDQGQEGDEKVVIKVQAQVVEDAGDRSKSTKVSYEDVLVTFQKQAGGQYLVDQIVITPVKL